MGAVGAGKVSCQAKKSIKQKLHFSQIENFPPLRSFFWEMFSIKISFLREMLEKFVMYTSFALEGAEKNLQHNKLRC